MGGNNASASVPSPSGPKTRERSSSWSIDRVQLHDVPSKTPHRLDVTEVEAPGHSEQSFQEEKPKSAGAASEIAEVPRFARARP